MKKKYTDVENLIEDKKVIIHTMPKYFMNSLKKTKESSKNFGILIMVIGLMILIAGSIFVYFNFLKKEEINTNLINPVKINSEKIIEDDKDDKNNDKSNYKEKKIKKPEKKDEIKKEVKQIIIATSTNKIATTTEKEIATSTIINKQKNYKQAVDSDNDGLNDIEEILLGCDSNLKDSDGDGYEDKSELFKMYNPSGKGKLIVNPNIKQYRNLTNNYSLYYLSSWSVNENKNDSIIFQIGEFDQFIQIIIQENIKNQTIEEWYKEQFSVSVIDNSQKVYKKAWTGIKNKDGLIVYLLSPLKDKIFILTYSVPEGGILNYQNIFEMMIKSLEIN